MGPHLSHFLTFVVLLSHSERVQSNPVAQNRKDLTIVKENRFLSSCDTRYNKIFFPFSIKTTRLPTVSTLNSKPWYGNNATEASLLCSFGVKEK